MFASTIGALLVVLIVAQPPALGSEERLGFEGEEGATVNEISLEIPEDLTDVGAPVLGSGNLEPRAEPDEDCVLFEFEFAGSIQPAATNDLAEVRGVVGRTSYCGDQELADHDTGEFELTITGERTIAGTVTFPGEAERLIARVATPVAARSATASEGTPLEFWIFASHS
ncbi:MAG: hypothetical protein ACE5GC_08070 [Acidimicrobiia bacterium]